LSRGIAGKVVLALLLATLLALVVAIPSTAQAARCFGKRATEVGTGGGEKIRGTGKKDAIVAKGGSDRISTGRGADRICAGKGKDKVNAGPGNDKVKGSGGNDKLNSGKGKDRLLAGNGNDTSNGGKGNDFIDGGKGRDTANGGPGVDTCVNVEVVNGCENQRPALHFDDQIDWGFSEDATGHDVVPGDTVTTQLRIGNGIPGAAGYTRSNVAPEGFLAGSSQNLTFLNQTGLPATDDANALVNFPFPVSFFGIAYTQAEVSTNGFVSFGAPALDYYTDFRPTAAQVGEFYRGAFPYWADLDLLQGGGPDPTPGVVSVVSAQDAVAIQWKDVGFHDGATPVRNFQIVFFRDGRIRYDYPGSNDPASGADQDEVIALSGGTGAASYTEIQRHAHTVPGSNILFTPNPLGTTGAAPAGTATAAIPPAATFASAGTDPRCSLTTAPTLSAPGSVSCPTPVLNVGGQDAFNVSWMVPMGGTPPTGGPDMNFSGQYSADSFTLTDAEQLLLETH
jgi:hypothetical protein